MPKPMEILFTVPIGAEGKVVCFKPADKVYMLEFTSPPDNRLTTVSGRDYGIERAYSSCNPQPRRWNPAYMPTLTSPPQTFCNALHLALDILEARHPLGVVLTTSAIPKFYSNGLDLVHASFTPGFFPDALYALWRRLLVYPMPTIALLNGHAFAGALMLAMMHDYRIMNPHRGFLCLNEVELGVPLRPPMSSVFRQKVGAQTYRTLVLEGKRFKALDALKEGIIDHVGGFDEAMAFIEDANLTTRAEKGVVGLLKREMWRETLHYLEHWSAERERDLQATLVMKKEALAREHRVKIWEAKVKL